MASITQRKTQNGTSYLIRVSRGRDSEGKQRTPYTTTWTPPEGWSAKAIERELNRVAGQFEADCNAGKVFTKEERREQEQRQKAEEERIRQEEERKVTLRKYALETFMPRKAATFSDNAIDSYTRTFIRIFKYLGDLKMEEIKPLDITNFITALQITEKVMQPTKAGTIVTDKPLSYSSIIKHYVVLHSLFTEAYRDDAILINPMDKVERPKPRKGEKEAEIKKLKVDEARRLLKLLEAEPLQWQAIIRLMLDTGCRRGEICGLRWSDCDFKNNLIHIQNNLQYTKAKGVFETTTKGNKSRTLDIDPEIMTLLKRLKASQKMKKIDGYCFIQPNCEPIHPQSPTRYLHKFGKRHGIEALHPHILRHTAATIAIQNGADIASVSEKLGHEDKSTTLDMYTHADQESIKQANEVYRAALYKEA